MIDLSATDRTSLGLGAVATVALPQSHGEHPTVNDDPRPMAMAPSNQHTTPKES